MNAYDYVNIGYPLPFIEDCWTNKELKFFTLHGAEGSLKTYVLKKNGYIYEKGNKLDWTGYYIIENPLLQYQIKFINGKIEKCKVYFKSSPTDFGISQFKSRFMLQNQLLTDLTEECSIICENFVKQLFSLRKVNRERVLISQVRDMMKYSPFDVKKIENVRNITLYDFLLLAKSAKANLHLLLLNDTIDVEDNESSFLEGIEEYIVETETLRHNFVHVMGIIIDFYNRFNLLKNNKQDFSVDPELFDLLNSVFSRVQGFVDNYEKARRKLPIRKL